MCISTESRTCISKFQVFHASWNASGCIPWNRTESCTGFRARQASNLQESQSYISRCYSGTSSTRCSLSIGVGISACRMAELASNVDYPNFKTAVHQRVDQENKNRPYLEIWSIMHALQLDEEHHNRKSKPSAKDESGKCLTNQGRAGEGSDPFKCLPNRCISTNVPCCLGPPRPKDRV